MAGSYEFRVTTFSDSGVRKVTYLTEKQLQKFRGKRIRKMQKAQGLEDFIWKKILGARP